MKTLLVTGGGGYIGTHTVLALLEAGYSIVVLDNFSNSCLESLARVKFLSGRDMVVISGDIRDRSLLDRIFEKYTISAVLHFAGLKSVSESVLNPLGYYDNNVQGTLVLIQAMTAAGVKNIVFSSSATVYGNPAVVPVDESMPVGAPLNPYGRTKLVIEQMLYDLVQSDRNWSVALLRYFNPVGAHPSGLIGEDPLGVPNNLLPYITRVAVGKLPFLSIFGGDYPTPDGTGVRDYIHVMDLADGHVLALQNIVRERRLDVWNLGTGVGYSVLQVVYEFEKASGVKIPFKIEDRRAGDIANCWADPTKAEAELGWLAERSLNDMMRDAWNWQKKNPEGYPK